MNKLLALTVLVAGTSFASFAHADDIALGQPGYGGSGCPAGSASATLSPDSKQLTIIFDSYAVNVGGDTNKSSARANCQLAIPVHIPQGLSISVIGVDYRGYNNIPKGAQTTFNVEYFFADQRGPTFKKTFSGPVDDNYFIPNQLTAQSVVFSKCGVDTNLRTATSIQVKTTQNKEAEATLDSEDVSAAITYQLQWKKC
jgi:hypothetical protein